MTGQPPPDAPPGAPDSPEGVPALVQKDDQDRVTFEGAMIEGAPHGQSTEYGPQGKVAQRASIAAGQLHGELRRYDDDGQVAMVAQYRQGVQHGYTAFYQKSRLVCRVRFVNGLQDGESLYYGANGVISARIGASRIKRVWSL